MKKKGTYKNKDFADEFLSVSSQSPLESLRLIKASDPKA